MLQKKGFTLVEVMVAALILVIAVAGIFSVFTFTKRSVNLPGSQFQAMNLSRQEAEELRVAVDYATYDTGNLAPGTYTDTITSGSFSGTKTYVVTNVDLDNDGINESRKVVITVNWDEPTP